MGTTLTEKNKLERFNTNSALLNRNINEPFLNHNSVACVETCMLYENDTPDKPEGFTLFMQNSVDNSAGN